MKLTLLGTGHAFVTECYNTCFVLHENENYFLVDAGGGNTILKRLKTAGIELEKIRHIFLTHKHIDHFMGIIWLIRAIAVLMKKDKYQGEVNIYAHGELIPLIKNTTLNLLQPNETQFIGNRIRLIPVEDGESRNIINHTVMFFDIHSTKTKQFGFIMKLSPGKNLLCHGDEPINAYTEKHVRGCEWLLHEAYCLSSQADKFKPYEKHHATVKDACETATRLNVKNLVLYHTEDENITNRKFLYKQEGSLSFPKEHLFVPNDLESIKIY